MKLINIKQFFLVKFQKLALFLLRKTYIKTVPVKLIRDQNDEHKKHPDSKFSRATIKQLGPNQVFLVIQMPWVTLVRGPTFISIRSGQHSSSTYFSHALDLDRLIYR